MSLKVKAALFYRRLIERLGSCIETCSKIWRCFCIWVWRGKY